MMDRELGPPTPSNRCSGTTGGRFSTDSNTSLEEAEAAYRQIYEHHVPLGHFLRDLGSAAPEGHPDGRRIRPEQSPAADVCESRDGSWIRYGSFLEEARSGGIALDSTTLEYTLRLTIEGLFEFRANPAIGASSELEAVVGMASVCRFEVVLWTRRTCGPKCAEPLSWRKSGPASEQGDQEARAGWSTSGPLAKNSYPCRCFRF